MTRGSTIHRASGLLALSLLCATEASGSTSYPAEVREVLQLSSTPACTLCHSSEVGGDDTAIRPFGVTMVRLGALGNEHHPSLDSALAAASQQRTDSDDDGTSDVDELRAGSDPNFAAGQDAPLTPMTGCAFGKRHDSSASLALALLCFGCLLTRARRRARPETLRAPDLLRPVIERALTSIQKS